MSLYGGSLDDPLGFIIYEIFMGETAKANAGSGNAASQQAFNTIKWIVTVGWAIYPRLCLGLLRRWLK